MLNIFSNSNGREEKDVIQERSATLDRIQSNLEGLLLTVEHARSNHNEIKRQNQILQAMIHAAGGYVWFKDSCGKFIWCDTKYCEDFLMVSPSYCAGVENSTVTELITEYIERTSNTHTFIDLVKATDAHCLDTKLKQRYIECGYIDENLRVMEIVKTPIFNPIDYVKHNPNVPSGIVGFGWDRTNQCSDLLSRLQEWIDQGIAVRIAKAAKDSSAYVIHPTDDMVGCSWTHPLPG